jgi:hypothetical protein
MYETIGITRPSKALSSESMADGMLCVLKYMFAEKELNSRGSLKTFLILFPKSPRVYTHNSRSSQPMSTDALDLETVQ